MAQMESTVDQALQQAVVAHKEGKLRQAEQLYRAILQAQPNHPDANHNLGVLTVAVGKPLEAIPFFKLALEANPQIEQFWLSYIDVLITVQRFDEAKHVSVEAERSGVSPEKLEALKQRLEVSVPNDMTKTAKGQTLSEKRKKLAEKKKNKKRKAQGSSSSAAPSPEQLNHLLGHYQAGRLVEAEALATSLTQQFPKHPVGWKGLGLALKQMGRLADSLTPMRTAVKLSPQDAEAHNNLGITLQELGRLDEAEATLRQAIALKPDYAEAHNNLGITRQELGRLDEAEASYRKAIAMKPGYAEAHNNLGITLQELGRLDEAEATLRQAIILKPGYASAQNNLGIALQELGRLDEAEASLRQAIALKSDYAEAHSNLGNTLQKLGRLDEAEASLRRAIAQKPDNAEAHYNLGNTLKELGRLEEAQASYKQAITLKPDYAEAHNNLGVTLQELGTLNEAETSLRRAIALKPNYAEAHYNLGNTLKELGRLEEAQASYKQAITLKSDYAEAHNNLGVALKELGRLDEAEANYKLAIALKPDHAEASRNILKLPVGQLDPKTLELCERAFPTPGEAAEDQVTYAFFQANLLKHRGLLDQSFSEFRKANKLKFETIKTEVALQSERYTHSFNRIKKWVPTVPFSGNQGLTKLFILGPSRSGKSSLEHILCNSSQVKPLFERLIFGNLSNANVDKKNVPVSLFDGIFFHSEDELLLQGYKVVTTTSPDSVFYADYLLDKLPNTFFLVINRDTQDLSAEIFTSDYNTENYYSYDINAIANYLNIYNNICDLLHSKVPDRCITVNFDDIIGSPKKSLERIGELVSQRFEVGSLNKRNAKFESASIFRDHFVKIMGNY